MTLFGKCAVGVLAALAAGFPVAAQIYESAPAGPGPSSINAGVIHPFSQQSIADTTEFVVDRLRQSVASGALPENVAALKESAVMEEGAACGIDQGRHGNCWFESSLAAVARFPRGQQIISAMVAEEAPGIYMVTFPGAPDTAVRIVPDDLQQLGIKDAAPWAAIIEAAEIKLFPGNSRGEVTGDWNVPNTTKGLSLLTGTRASYIVFANCSEKRIANMLEYGCEHGHAMVATSESSRNNYAQPVVPDHAYAIIAYDPQQQIVTLRNPWGHNAGRSVSKIWPAIPQAGQVNGGVANIGAGLLQLNLSTFKHFYRNLASAKV